jgi:hypothetical protein
MDKGGESCFRSVVPNAGPPAYSKTGFGAWTAEERFNVGCAETAGIVSAKQNRYMKNLRGP